MASQNEDPGTKPGANTGQAGQTPGTHSTQTGRYRSDFGEEVRSAAGRAEEDLQRLIRYLNDEVVPDVRKHSSTALHAAADGLRSLAQKMDDHRP